MNLNRSKKLNRAVSDESFVGACFSRTVGNSKASSKKSERLLFCSSPFVTLDLNFSGKESDIFESSQKYTSMSFDGLNKSRLMQYGLPLM